MKISTYSEYRWNGDRYVLVHDESFDYVGPVAECKGGGGIVPILAAAAAVYTGGASLGAWGAGDAALGDLAGGGLGIAGTSAADGLASLGVGAGGAVAGDAAFNDLAEGGLGISGTPAAEGLTALQPGILQQGANLAKDIWGNPIGKQAIQSGVSATINGVQQAGAAKQQKAFNDQLAGLLTSANSQSYGAANATPLSAGLTGSRGAVDPAGTVASMGRAAPVAPVASAAAGTQSAPSMPSSDGGGSQQGAVNLGSTPRMFA